MDPALAPAMNRFGLDLFLQLSASRKNENLFISPSSIAMALAMTHGGAAGETQQAMARVLHLEGLSLQQANEANAGLQRSLLAPDSGVTLSIANSLWARQGVDFKEDFLERNRLYYGAEVAALDFNSPAAGKRINKWVKESTGGKIEKIVPDTIGAQTVMFLINAIYFEGKWQKPFIKTDTREQPFHLGGGGEKQVPMMSQHAVFPYYRGQGFQAVQLPYVGRMRMVVFLPDPESNLETFLSALNADNWERWMAGFQEASGLVALPRFKTESTVRLNEALKALGMEIAFDAQRADFSGMRPIPPNLYINEVRHKTFVEVDEVGTVAAAATMVEILVLGAPSATFTFVADRPFFYAIEDNVTGVLLFMGALREP